MPSAIARFDESELKLSYLLIMRKDATDRHKTLILSGSKNAYSGKKDLLLQTGFYT